MRKWILALGCLLNSTMTSAMDKPVHHKINYIEIPATQLQATKVFFTQVFGWTFTDYGPEYASFAAQGVDGGFFQSDLKAETRNGSPLIVIYSADLESTQQAVTHAGGLIVKPVFSFPGGRRFHFSDPSGNEFAVWSE